MCDIQEKFRPLIFQSETVIRRSVFVHELSKVLDIPTITTEHYREVFGPTVPDFTLTGPVFQKRFLKIFVVFLLREIRQFSMMTEEVTSHFASLNRNQVILCGIEAHACILQTAMDLINEGKEVHIICDAVSSQRLVTL